MCERRPVNSCLQSQSKESESPCLSLSETESRKRAIGVEMSRSNGEKGIVGRVRFAASGTRRIWKGFCRDIV